jgi:2-polyprenyl-3-methyl-5-hydroxy-6-metoxy-1,4-benzoquinol methylase
MPNVAPSFFERSSQTFELDPRALQWILADPANPLNQLASLIPSGSRVLDIGDGNGLLARLLHHVHEKIEIDGVEPDTTAVHHASPWYRNLYRGTVDEFLAQVGPSTPYDFIVLADVLEHLSNPERVLRALRDRVDGSARICISTPNVAFASVRIALLNGAFEYVDSGILERTHLRFFTLHSLRRLFAAVDLYPETTYLLKRNPLHMEIRLSEFRVSPFLLWRLLQDELSTAYQFLFVLGSKRCESTVTTVGDEGRHVVLKYLVERLKKKWLFAPWSARG